MRFSVNEKVVYPGHGVAYIRQILQKDVGSTVCCFYELNFLHKDATVLVPIDSAEIVGLRNLSSVDHVEDAFTVLTNPARKLSVYEFTASSWNKRNKQYQIKIRKGRLLDLSEIYRDLKYMETVKELSFGERRLLNKAEALLVEEISEVVSRDEEQTIEHIRSLCGIAYRRQESL